MLTPALSHQFPLAGLPAVKQAAQLLCTFNRNQHCLRLLQVVDAALLAQYQALLTAAERAHVAAAADAVLRRERLLARALVRTVLARRVSHIRTCAQFFKNPPGQAPSRASQGGTRCADAASYLTGRAGTAGWRPRSWCLRASARASRSCAAPRTRPRACRAGGGCASTCPTRRRCWVRCAALARFTVEAGLYELVLPCLSHTAQCYT